MLPGRSFTARLVIPVTVSAAVVIVAGLFVDYRISRGRILSELEQNARSSVSSGALRISEMSAGVESSVRLLGEAIQGVPDRNRIEQVLRGVIDSNPHIFAAAIAIDPAFSPGGKGLAPYLYRGRQGLAHTDLALAGKPYWEEPWFTRVRESGRPLWVEPYVEESAAQTLMTTFSAPLFRLSADGTREFIGVATADLALADLYGYLSGLRLDGAGFGFLLTARGLLVGAPAETVVSKPIASVLPPINAEGLDPWLETGGSEPLHTQVRCPGSEEICQLRLRPVAGDSHWSVGVVYSEETLLRPLRDYQLRVLLVGLGMLVVLPLVIGLIAGRLLRPLLGLAAASESIARGALDVNLPASRGDDEIARLVRAFDRMRDDLGRYITEIESAAALRSRMEGELSAAHEIQMAMLPQGGEARLQCPPVELWARVRPARAVGGDLYSFEHTGNRLLFSIGDVSDKGVPAALFMARAISLIQQWEVQPDVPPDIAMQQLNHGLSRDNDNCMFLTLLIGALDLNTLELQFASAGHSAPVLLRDGTTAVVAQERGPALGLQEGLSFVLNRLQLRADDRLVLYTDGFDEAQNRQEQLLGEQALRKIIAAPDRLPLAEAGGHIFAATDAFSDGAAQADDMTLLLLEISGNRRQPLQADRGSLMIDAGLPGEAARWLEDQWQAQGLAPEKLHDLQLVLEEIVCNIRDHAETEAHASIALSLERFEDRIELECVDPGQAYNPLEEAPRAALGSNTEDAEIGGLGLHLITSLTDEQFYRREAGRNILRVRLALPPSDHRNYS